jgi:hypothetical protein
MQKMMKTRTKIVVSGMVTFVVILSLIMPTTANITNNNKVNKNENDPSSIETFRMSVTAAGEQLMAEPDPFGDPFDRRGSCASSISANGRYVAFVSDMDNLPGFSYTYYLDEDEFIDRVQQVYVNDRDADNDGIYDEDEPDAVNTVLISRNTITGDASNGDCGGYIGTDPFCPEEDGERDVAHMCDQSIGMSNDGRFIVYTSYGDNLVCEYCDGNSNPHVFFHDRDVDENGIFDEPCVPGDPVKTCTEMIDIDCSTGEPFSKGAWNADLSDDGRFVVMEVNCPNEPIWVKDRACSGDDPYIKIPKPSGVGGNLCNHPKISSDGRYVTFSGGTHLEGTDYRYDIFRFDIHTQEMLTIAQGGPSEDAYSDYPALSDDGSRIAFISWADNLIEDDDNEACDVFVWAETTDDIIRISQDSSGAGGDCGSGQYCSGWPSYNRIGYCGVAISPDGMYVAFASKATNLVDMELESSHPNVFLYNGYTQEISLISIAGDGGEPNHESCWPAVAQNGAFVTFSSAATNLLEIEEPFSDTNGEGDVYLRYNCGCYQLGDLNCDHQVDIHDINPFTLALTSAYQEPPFYNYYITYPLCNPFLADINGDGQVTIEDINPFVALLAGG